MCKPAQGAAVKPPESKATFNEAWAEAHLPRQTHIDAVLDQVDYAVELAGIDHVGVGSEFDGVGGELPDALRTVADFPNFVAGLQARGYKDEDIRKSSEGRRVGKECVSTGRSRGGRENDKNK